MTTGATTGRAELTPASAPQQPQTNATTDEEQDGEISILAVLTTIIRKRYVVFGWSLAGGIFAAAMAWQRPVVFQATTTFATQSSSAAPSGLSSLAGQLGLISSGAGTMTSPDFYIMLVKSPVLLSKVVHDTLVVPEFGGRRMTIFQLFHVPGADSADREEHAMNTVKSMVDASQQTGTGLMQLTVTSAWRSVALSLASAILNAVDEYNKDTRRTQAAVERTFIEGRMAQAQADLDDAENRLQEFLAANREISPSSALSFRRDDLARTVQLKQQLYTTLAVSYEDARIREVRDTPIINVIEPPRADRNPKGRGRVKATALGLVIGALVGLIMVLISDAVKRVLNLRRDEANELFASVREVGSGITGVFRRGR